MTEYYSRVDYIYTSGDTTFSIPFSYIDKEHIKVFVNDEEIFDYNYLTESQIQITKTLNVGDSVAITRTTSINERMVVFSDTSILNEKNQNLSAQQTFNIVQEVYDSLNNHKKDVETLKPYIETAARNIEHIIGVNENKENIDTIADSIENVNAVGQSVNNVNTVGEAITDVEIVADNITNVNTSATNITNINTVANSINDVNTVSSEIVDITTVAGISQDIPTVANISSDVTAVKNNAENISTVANSINKVNTVSNSINNVNTAANNIGNINAAAGNAANINKVANVSSQVKATGDNITDVVSVANNLGIIGDLSAEIDRIDQSKGKESGNISTDNDLLKDIKSYAHSTFDLSKFTVVGSLNISDDGIVSGFSSSNYLKTPIIDLSKPFKIREKFKTGNIYNQFHFGCPFSLSNQPTANWSNYLEVLNSNIQFFGRLSDDTDFNLRTGGSNSDNTEYEFEFSWDGNVYTLKKFKDGVLQGTPASYNSTLTLYNADNCNIVLGVFDTSKSTYPLTDGSIDLKQFSITADGVEVFSGNKTGIDTYTIGGDTVTIPYTLSKTGAKIVDSQYRDRVQDVYNYQGYAPYYTLSDTDFTLPMGELYGMIERNRFNGILGQTIFSLDPLYHDNLHLLDGALLQGEGIYKSFIDNYIKPLYAKQPSRFISEADWQASVTNYGVCGYYVYDSTNNTVRLPKVTGFVEGTLDSTALGQLVQAGLPVMTSSYNGDHTHTRGTMEITGWIDNLDGGGYVGSAGGAFAKIASNTAHGRGMDDSNHGNYDFYASRTWTGSTSSNGGHTHTVSWGATTDTVQPQSIKGYMYIVVATGDSGYYPTNTSGIITEVNSKADVSLSNVNNSAKVMMSAMGMPSERYIDLTLGASGTQYTAPANGWFVLRKVSTETGQYIRIFGVGGMSFSVYAQANNNYLEGFVPVTKNSHCSIYYTAAGTVDDFRFIYAKGSESEM